MWRSYASPEALLADAVELATLPEVYLRVESLAADPRSSAQEIGRVVCQDTALTARLLQLVNSAYYGHPSRIDTASRAISVIGIDALRDLALAVNAVETFTRVPNELVDMAAFWRHSVFCGLLARLMARRSKILHDERLFVAGLLHDVGRLLFFSKMPEQAALTLSRRSGGGAICTIERELFGFDHAQLGAALLASWRLPAVLQETVAFHHHPDLATAAALEASLVHLANAVTHDIERSAARRPLPYWDPYAYLLQAREHLPAGEQAGNDGAQACAWALTGLDEEAVAALVQEASADFAEVLDIIYPS